VILWLHDYYIHTFCIVLRLWFQFAALASLIWTNCVAVYLLVFVSSLETAKTVNYGKAMPIFHLASWGLPVVCVAISIPFSSKIYESTVGMCLQEEPWHIILWFTPVIISLLLSLFMFLIIIWKLCKAGGIFHKKQLRLVRRVAVFIAILLCWVPDLLTYFLDFGLKDCYIFALAMIYSILRNGQGFWDAVAYGYINYSEVSKLYADTSVQSRIALTTLLVIFSPILVIPLGIHWIYSHLKCEHKKTEPTPPVQDNEALLPAAKEQNF